MLTPQMTEKPGDLPGDVAHREHALKELKAAMAHEVSVRDDAQREVAARAEAAVWLGSSLADLATVTGRSRQAAGQRWPGLGDIARRRRWLSYHLEEVLWASALVADNATEFPHELVSKMVDAVGRFNAQEPSTTVEAVGRWRLLETIVDRYLRELATVEAKTEGAEFARHGAEGVVGHFDGRA